MKGYEYAKGEYVELERKELETLRIPSKRTLEIKQFVKADQVDLAYFEKPYFGTKAAIDIGGAEAHSRTIVAALSKDNQGAIYRTCRFRPLSRAR